MTESGNLENFMTLVKVCNSTGRNVEGFDTIVKEFIRAEGGDPNNIHEEQGKLAEIMSKEQYLAIAFLLSANRKKYGKILEDLMNQFLQGDSNTFSKKTYQRP